MCKEGRARTRSIPETARSTEANSSLPNDEVVQQQHESRWPYPTYHVDYDAITDVSNALSERILTFQGDGDYEGVVSFVEKYGQVGAQLQADLDRLSAAGIPVDVTFEQGPSVLGL